MKLMIYLLPCLLPCLLAGTALAGGTIGGSTGGQALFEQLMVSTDQYRRIEMRLSAGKNTLRIADEDIQLQKIADGIFDLNMTKKIVPIQDPAK